MTWHFAGRAAKTRISPVEYLRSGVRIGSLTTELGSLGFFKRWIAVL